MDDKGVSESFMVVTFSMPTSMPFANNVSNCDNDNYIGQNIFIICQLSPNIHSRQATLLASFPT